MADPQRAKHQHLGHKGAPALHVGLFLWPCPCKKLYLAELWHVAGTLVLQEGAKSCLRFPGLPTQQQ